MISHSFRKSGLLMLMAGLLILFPLGARAQEYNNTPLKTILKEITARTGYTFVYSDALKADDEKVTFRLDEKLESIEPILNHLFEGRGISYKIQGKQILLTPADIAPGNGIQPQLRRGVIRDEKGESLIGVAVQNLDNGKYSATGLDGDYSIEAKEGDRLRITFLGMQTIDVTVGKAGVQDFVLKPDIEQIEGSVVTGYQTISKERATGSFAKVTAEGLRDKRPSDISTMLEGQVAGFNTQSNLIRGTSTMNGVAQPLFVIDGFPVENTRYNQYGSIEESIPDLDVNDIESITVLKDAAAASIYGARAANGVVVIVTKKATEKRTAISFNTSLTWRPYRYYTGHLTDAADIVDLEREWAASNPKLQGAGAAAYAQSLVDDNVYTSQGIKAIANYYAGNISQSEMDQTLNKLAQQGYRYYDDVAKYAKRAALYQQYNLGVGRASEGNNLKASLTYRNNHLNDINSKDNGLSINVRDVLDITPWLKLEMGSYTSFKRGTSQTFNVMSPGYTWQPYDQLAASAGTWYTNTAADRMSKSNQTILSQYGLYSEDITPLEEIGRNLQDGNQFLNRTYGNLNVALPAGFRYNVMYQYEYVMDQTRLLYDKESHYVRHLVNQYATAGQDGTVAYNVPYGNIYFRENQSSKAWTFRQQLNFDRTFGGKHNVVALAGHEARRSEIEYNNSTLYNYDPDMLSFAMVDEKKLSNTYGLMGGYGLSARNFAYQRYLDNRFISLYANAAYTYDNKYLLSASIRWDRSNLWGTSSKYQKKPIWSVGAGWNVDREPWFNVSWADRLKLRASYGIAGNVAKNAAPYMTASYYQNNNVGSMYGSVSTRPNPDLRWEKTTTTNLAVDFDLLKGRLSGSFEWYNKMGTDLLANTMGVPTEGFGYTTYMINNGKMRNRGVELTLHASLVRTNDFNFDASVTWSHNKNEVVYVNVTCPFYILQLDYPEAYPIIGNPYNAIYAYQWAKLSDKGLPQVLDESGNPSIYNPSSLDAIIYAGSTEPTDLASLNLSLRYRNFSLSCLWMYMGGHQLRNTDIPMLHSAYNSAMGYVSTIAPVNKDITKRWRKPGDEATTDVPAAIFAENPLFSSASETVYSYADCNVISATNLRLANISLAYDFPSRWVRKAALTGARLQFNVENAVTFAKSPSAKYLLGGYAAPNYVFGLLLNL